MYPRRSIGIGLALVAGATMLSGCHDRHSKVTERREIIVQHEPAPPPREVVIERYEPAPPPETVVITEEPAREVIIVREAPPPIIVETCPPPPVIGMVWVQGYWVHDHGHYSWYKGRHVRPVPDHRFEPARWEHSQRGWQFHRERWAPEPGPRGQRDHGGSRDHGDRGGSRDRGDSRNRDGSHDRSGSRR